MEIGGPQVPNYLIGADGSIVRCKVLEIGAWNMDTTQVKGVTHNLEQHKILSVNAIIRSDNDALDSYITGWDGWATGNIGDLMIDAVTATGLTLVRRTGGRYDNAALSSVAISRGWVIIWYKD